MRPKYEVLEEFESGLNVDKLHKSKIKAQLIGYGEISAIFTLDDYDDWAIKRLPLFSSLEEAEEYKKLFIQYCNLLKSAGVSLPPQENEILQKTTNLYCFYVLQQSFSPEYFCHNLLHTAPKKEFLDIYKKVINALNNIQKFNLEMLGDTQLAIDGQLSNWVYKNGDLFYIDTSTPLLRKNKEEQMNPDLFLNSAPAPFRIIIKKFFLSDVLNRYYVPKMIYIDLLANLYKEGKKEWIPDLLKITNELALDGEEITKSEIDSYYKEDKMIWRLFMRARRIDKWITKKIFRREYQHILPGKIKR